MIVEENEVHPEQPEIELISPADTIDQLGAAVSFLPLNSVGKLITDLYDDGFMICKANPLAVAALADSFSKDRPVTAGPVQLFALKYAKEFILVRAEKIGVPVIFVKSQIEKSVDNMYAIGVYIGSAVSEEKSAKIKEMFAAGDKRLLIALKPQQKEQECQPNG